MTQTTTLLGSSDPLGNLSAEEKAVVKSLLHQFFSPSSQLDASPAEDCPTPLNLITLIEQVGADLEAVEVSDNLIDQMLDEQDDGIFIDLLRDQVMMAQTVIQTLSERSLGRSSVETLSQLDLQLIALQISIDDLDNERHQQTTGMSHPKRDQLKRFLLKEFRFINNWARRL